MLTVFTVLLAVGGERANDEEYITGEAAEMEKHKSKGYFITAVNLCFSKLLITHFSKKLMKFHNAHLALQSNPARNQSEPVINDSTVNIQY